MKQHNDHNWYRSFGTEQRGIQIRHCRDKGSLFAGWSIMLYIRKEQVTVALAMPTMREAFEEARKRLKALEAAHNLPMCSRHYHRATEIGCRWFDSQHSGEYNGKRMWCNRSIKAESGRRYGSNKPCYTYEVKVSMSRRSMTGKFQSAKSFGEPRIYFLSESISEVKKILAVLREIAKSLSR